MARGEVIETGEGGPRRPLRRCFVTRRVQPRETLIRFVVDPGGHVVPDVAARLPGRGMWLSADRDVVNTACAKNAFAKGFRAAVDVEADLPRTVERLLARRCGEALGLARRAGDAVAGFEKVRAMLAAGACGALVVAADAGDDGPRKLGAIDPDVPRVTVLSAAEMTAALGREHAVYAAVRRGPLARRLIVEATRLAGVRGDAQNRVVAVR